MLVLKFPVIPALDRRGWLTTTLIVMNLKATTTKLLYP
jgi:hypothetical protein